jgi:hypothetical protein
MARRYTTAIAFKSALEDRLKRRVQENGADLDRLRQRSIFERFLARAVAHFGDRIILKGGIALQLRIEDARATHDVDLVCPVIRAVCSTSSGAPVSSCSTTIS